MWNGHTFALGNSSSFQPNSSDDFVYNGNYYSALAPGTPVLALPFVGLGFLLEGHFDVFNQVMLLSELFVALVNSIAAFLVYSVARFFFDKRVSVFLAFAYAFSTVSWAFSTYFFQSDVSACFDILAVFFALRAVRGKKQLRDTLLSGGAMAIAITVDYVNVVLFPIVMVYFLASGGQMKPVLKPVLGFVFVGFLGIVAILAYNYVNFGSPLRTTEQLYLHSNNVLSEFSYPLYFGAYLNLFTAYRGLRVYSLFLIIRVFGLYDGLKNQTGDERDSSY